jgi:hypothetical protein
MLISTESRPVIISQNKVPVQSDRRRYKVRLRDGGMVPETCSFVVSLVLMIFSHHASASTTLLLQLDIIQESFVEGSLQKFIGLLVCASCGNGFLRILAFTICANDCLVVIRWDMFILTPLSFNALLENRLRIYDTLDNQGRFTFYSAFLLLPTRI